MGKIEALGEKGQNCWNPVEDGMGEGISRAWARRLPLKLSSFLFLQFLIVSRITFMIILPFKI